MNRYEYRAMQASVAQLSDEAFVRGLNAMGAEGWNLVVAVPHERHGYSHEVHFLFSRLAQSPAEKSP
ncbi:hypothetical protein BH11MYX4_BH11MYX4_55480 [soil metagenome]